MTRQVLSFVVAWGVVMSPVWAAERSAFQKARGGFKTTGDAVISGSAEVVTGVAFSCGSTACVLSLYDGASITADNLTNANGIFEDGAAANTGKYVALDPPIRTTSGVLLRGDLNVNGVVVFTEQATP